MLTLFILLPLFLFFILNLPFKSLRLTSFMPTAVLLIIQVLLVLAHPIFPWSIYPDSLQPFFVFNLSGDNLTLVSFFTIGIVGLAGLFTASDAAFSQRQKSKFISLLLIGLTGMNATVLTRDIFTLYLFIEITAIVSFILIALEMNKSAIEGVFKYLMLSAIATVFMLSGIAFFLLAAGDLSFSAIHSAFSQQANNFPLKFAMGLFLCGILIKSGVIPFHGWLVDAYSAAPACVSVLLAGIITKISGVYVLLRLFGSVFILNHSFQTILLLTGAVSIVIAALAALTQDDFKRMLSYSSISQVGYIVLALGCATPLAFCGALFHFFNHAIFKSLLFVNSAALEKQYGSTDINKLADLGVKMPITGFTSLIGMLSTAGIPPLSGFWSKLIIVIALFSAGYVVYGVIALLSGVLTLAYFLAFQRRVFFTKTARELKNNGGGSFNLKFVEITLAIITAFAGIAIIWLKDIWR